MRIICTVNEFAKMVRKCSGGSCYGCVMSDVCGDQMGIERFISAEDVISEPDADECNRKPE